MSAHELEEALSLERFARYLAWAGGDHTRALELYALNTRLSEALYTPLQMLEVALRNRIHSVLTAAWGERWFEDERFEPVANQREQLVAAKADLLREHKEPTPGRVVAALTFSFWTSMLSPAHENLWQMTLHPIARREDGKGLRRKDLSRPLTPIRVLRNRVAHHEPILAWDLPKHHGAILQVTTWLSPAAAAWCRKHSRFDQVFPPQAVQLHPSEAEPG
ncbi:MAG: Abi family protein [Acetobacteraceae bacterium]|nr:Abi family protein [Acetobacteraceae bacterium]